MNSLEGEEEVRVDYVYKVIVIGDSSVGKSKFSTRFAKNEFSFDSKSTLCVEFQSRTVTINSKVIKAQIWDTAGQERYRAVTSAYYRGALGAIVVYDITKRKSFDHVATWIDELRAHANSSIVIMLIGNKVDLSDDRDVATEDAVEFAEHQGLLFSEASAFTGDNVESAFFRLIEQIYSNQTSKKTLDSDSPRGNKLKSRSPVSNRGSETEVIAGSDLKIGEMKNVSQCSCY